MDAVLFYFQAVTYSLLCTKYGLCLKFLVIVRVEGTVFFKSLSGFVLRAFHTVFGTLMKKIVKVAISIIKCWVANGFRRGDKNKEEKIELTNEDEEYIWFIRKCIAEDYCESASEKCFGTEVNMLAYVSCYPMLSVL